MAVLGEEWVAVCSSYTSQPAPLTPTTATLDAKEHWMLTSISCGKGAAGYWKYTFLVFNTAFVRDFTPETERQ